MDRKKILAFKVNSAFKIVIILVNIAWVYVKLMTDDLDFDFLVQTNIILEKKS